MNPNSVMKQGEYLSILTLAPADKVKQFAEMLLDALGQITVLQNRTGLVMLPYRDTAQGSAFYLGEILVAEAHVKLEHHNAQGYAVCTGRDLEQALAVAILDAALQAGLEQTRVESFILEQHQHQQMSDEVLLKQVESTRVVMETF
jgi:alpha-D-ribose 1-methylphosphonate 5-triphosphate synthase subunit PhnG